MQSEGGFSFLARSDFILMGGIRTLDLDLGLTSAKGIILSFD